MLGPIIALVLGLSLMLGAGTAANLVDEDEDDITVDGVVVRVIDVDANGRLEYRPVVGFEAQATGERHEAIAPFTVTDQPEVGDDYRVTYPEGVPSAARVLQEGPSGSLWLFAGLGLVVTSVALVRLLVKLSRLRSDAGEYRDALASAPPGSVRRTGVMRRAVIGGAPTAPPRSEVDAPLGWYRDPYPSARIGDERWWDGGAWTDHTRNLMSGGSS